MKGREGVRRPSSETANTWRSGRCGKPRRGAQGPGGREAGAGRSGRVTVPGGRRPHLVEGSPDWRGHEARVLAGSRGKARRPADGQTARAGGFAIKGSREMGGSWRMWSCNHGGGFLFW